MTKMDYKELMKTLFLNFAEDYDNDAERTDYDYYRGVAEGLRLAARKLDDSNFLLND